VYLFSYMKPAFQESSGATDPVDADYKTALNTYGQAWITGFSDGVNTYVRSGPNGATATSRTVLTYLSHRDFPR
jgi:hypothetical protein